MRFLILLIVLALIGVGVLEWANAAWDVPGPAAPNGGETVVLIPPHNRTHDTAMLLQQKGVLKYGLLFEFDLRVSGLAEKIKAGEYAIASKASMSDIARILVEGKSIQHKLTAAEGLTSEMIWKLVSEDKILVGDAGPVPPEGSLLPETYLFTRGETRAHLLAKMAKAQKKFLTEQWLGRAQGLPLKSVREAVILASIVEKETALPEERRHIASVFVNRLKAGIKLQSDPTIIYGLTKGYALGRGIRQSEILAATPYNTYVIDGLPPQPICNPGKDALAAVLNPEQGKDLYFVANGAGGHVFASSMGEHLRNVAALRVLEHQPAAPEPKPVEANGRADAASVSVPDQGLPVLPPKAVKHKKRVKHHA
jgi:UPF0755 protein